MARRVDRIIKGTMPGLGNEEVTFRLTYQTARPHEVLMTFIFQDARPTWTLGRDLIRLGLLNVQGEGDVIIFPCGDDLLSITLTAVFPGDSSLTILAPVLEIGAFLAETADLVPYGSERIDIDAELRKLLES